MGILNVTPDSFSDGGLYFEPEAAISRGLSLIDEGADIIDIGGESSRPFSKSISLEEELRRVIPVFKALKGKIPLSIDTVKPEVADLACLEGAALINDIQGFRNIKMLDAAKRHDASICIMHMQGTPPNMKINPSYNQGVIDSILCFFEDRIKAALNHGIKKEKIILDPGIGFGKTVDDNVRILHNLKEFKGLGYPLLVGLSRKSFMTKILEKPPAKLLGPTIAMNTLIWREADYVRVHDVEAHRDVFKLLEYGWK
ncbi:MAG: dihydropteroate synthase [Parachlamydiaceae bacterium]